MRGVRTSQQYVYNIPPSLMQALQDTTPLHSREVWWLWKGCTWFAQMEVGDLWSDALTRAYVRRMF
jgi:hypothetical protein